MLKACLIREDLQRRAAPEYQTHSYSQLTIILRKSLCVTHMKKIKIGKIQILILRKLFTTQLLKNKKFYYMVTAMKEVKAQSGSRKTRFNRRIIMKNI